MYEILDSEADQYAAAILEKGFHNNYASAKAEAEKMLRGETGLLTADYEKYYFIHSESWNSPYIVKLRSLPFSTKFGYKLYVKNDLQLGRYK